MRRQITNTSIAILAFCAGISASFFTLPLWVVFAINVSKEGSRTDWLGFVGSLLGSVLAATVATIAIRYAWKGIVLQTRISMLSREESRYESELPGLHEANEKVRALLSILVVAQWPQSVLNLLQAHGIGKQGSIFSDEVRAWLPQLDDRTRRGLTEKLFKVNLCAITGVATKNAADLARDDLAQISSFAPDHRQKVLDELEWGREELAKQQTVLQAAIGELNQFYLEEIQQRIARIEAAMPQIRREIEEFVGNTV